MKTPTKMRARKWPRRRPKDWPRDPLPLGTIRWREYSRGLFIKVRMDGPRWRRWKQYGRWLWEKCKGPVPAGKIVIQVRGDPRRPHLGDLALGTVADNAFLWHSRNPVGSAANYAALRQATGEYNRLRGVLNRRENYLVTRWYPVDHNKRVVLNRPCRARWQCYGLVRRPLAGGRGWAGSDALALGWPAHPWEEACVLAALADAGRSLRVRELLPRIAALRERYGWPAQETPRRRLYSVASKLRGLGLVTGLCRGSYRLTDAGRQARGPACPWVPVWGPEAARLGYRKIDPDELPKGEAPWQ